MSQQTVAKPSRREGRHALRENDLITVKECHAIVDATVRDALLEYERTRLRAIFHAQRWHRRAWRFVKALVRRPT